MTTKKTKKALLNILKEEFNKKKKSKTESKEQPVEIYGENSSVKDISLDDIKMNRSWNIREDILEWRHSDFVIYIKNKFNEKIDPTWDCDKIAMVLYFGSIKDKISEVVSFCDNIVIKDYVDFFIDNWAEYYWKEKGNFTLWYMNNDLPLKAFFKGYDYNESFRNYFSDVETKKEDKKEINSKEIENHYYASGEGLILEYGLLIPLNWLVEYKKRSIDHAILYIIGAFGSLCSSGNWREVIHKTESFNPYPDKFIIRDCDEIFEKLNLNIKLNLTFSERDWCGF